MMMNWRNVQAILYMDISNYSNNTSRTMSYYIILLDENSYCYYCWVLFVT